MISSLKSLSQARASVYWPRMGTSADTWMLPWVAYSLGPLMCQRIIQSCSSLSNQRSAIWQACVVKSLSDAWPRTFSRLHRIWRDADSCFVSPVRPSGVGVAGLFLLWVISSLRCVVVAVTLQRIARLVLYRFGISQESSSTKKPLI